MSACLNSICRRAPSFSLSKHRQDKTAVEPHTKARSENFLQRIGHIELSMNHMAQKIFDFHMTSLMRLNLILEVVIPRIEISAIPGFNRILTNSEEVYRQLDPEFKIMVDDSHLSAAKEYIFGTLDSNDPGEKSAPTFQFGTALYFISLPCSDNCHFAADSLREFLDDPIAHVLGRLAYSQSSNPRNKEILFDTSALIDKAGIIADESFLAASETHFTGRMDRLSLRILIPYFHLRFGTWRFMADNSALADPLGKSGVVRGPLVQSLTIGLGAKVGSPAPSPNQSLKIVYASTNQKRRTSPPPYSGSILRDVFETPEGSQLKIKSPRSNRRSSTRPTNESLREKSLDSESESLSSESYMFSPEAKRNKTLGTINGVVLSPPGCDDWETVDRWNDLAVISTSLLETGIELRVMDERVVRSRIRGGISDLAMKDYGGLPILAMKEELVFTVTNIANSTSCKAHVVRPRLELDTISLEEFFKISQYCYSVVLDHIIHANASFVGGVTVPHGIIGVHGFHSCPLISRGMLSAFTLSTMIKPISENPMMNLNRVCSNAFNLQTEQSALRQQPSFHVASKKNPRRRGQQR